MTIAHIKLPFVQGNRKTWHTLLLFWHILIFTSVLHKMTLIGHAHSSQFMEQQNLGITTLNHATCAPIFFKKIAGKSENYRFHLPNFLKFCDNISHKLLRPSNSWKKLWKFWNGPLSRNKSFPFPLLNVVAHWQSSNTETCSKKLSKILANNIDNGWSGIGLRIYVKYCSLCFY